MFITCRELVQKFYEYDLQTFELTSRQIIECRHRSGATPADVFKAVGTAFELKAVLSALGSGDPYLNWELAGPCLSGRTDAIKVMARTLRKYAREANRLLAEKT